MFSPQFAFSSFLAVLASCPCITRRVMHTCASHLCSMVLCWRMQNLPGFVNLLIRQLSFGACVFRREFFYVKIWRRQQPSRGGSVVKAVDCHTCCGDWRPVCKSLMMSERHRADIAAMRPLTCTPASCESSNTPVGLFWCAGATVAGVCCLSWRHQFLTLVTLGLIFDSLSESSAPWLLTHNSCLSEIASVLRKKFHVANGHVCV